MRRLARVVALPASRASANAGEQVTEVSTARAATQCRARIRTPRSQATRADDSRADDSLAAQDEEQAETGLAGSRGVAEPRL